MTPFEILLITGLAVTLLVLLVLIIVLAAYISGSRKQAKNLIKTNNGLYSLLMQRQAELEDLHFLLEEAQDTKAFLTKQNAKIIKNIDDVGTLISDLDISTTEKIHIITELKK